MTIALYACSKLADISKKKSKRKKKSCRTSLSGDGTPPSITDNSALDDNDPDLPVTPKSGLDSDLSDADLAPDQAAASAVTQARDLSEADSHASAQTRSGHSGEDSSEASTALDSSKEVAAAHHSRTSSATADLESASSAADLGMDSAGQEAVRAALEAAVTQANSAIEVGVAAGDDVLQRVLDELDAAIDNAVEGSVSAKYSRKVRKRLQQLLHEAISAAASGDEESAAAAAATAAAQKQEWQTAGVKTHRTSPSKAESGAATSSHSGKHHALVVGQSPMQRQHHRQGHGQARAQFGSALDHVLPASGVVGPPPPPPPRLPPPPPPKSQQGRPEQPNGSAAQSPGGPGHVRAQSGNAWGMPAKHRLPAQVSIMHVTVYVQSI